MSSPYSGGCDHVKVTASAEPIDNHECHCNVCKNVTGQHTTHVAFFNHDDLKAEGGSMNRQPFNADNPDGPLELCTCADCGAALMLDDKQKRIRVAVPNVMGYDDAAFPDATYHAFWDESKGYAKPDDGRPVYEGLRPDFSWPQPAA
ncbi:Glutathione-dependent formaldehyde-activating enzyme [Roseovarius sp. THAF27]|uniref:GFA family protein n=1 Tax=unclassified Roseovarius TaxID=2614913 RepID=UPI001268F4EE|nr:MULTISPECIES: GFA family protein [unclassified Roseovarius]QFT82190.1 Glutathione-dependent formaldehyde-activating enzyme [Roseovarius sp. THAF27]QFT98778.1 Glutathione-dependent formaldehyde-activating enzyme [Roseovarius sp. THAF8]